MIGEGERVLTPRGPGTVVTYCITRRPAWRRGDDQASYIVELDVGGRVAMLARMVHREPDTHDDPPRRGVELWDEWDEFA